MKRPSFQFYPSDWQNNAKLRRCEWAARGVWLDVMCLMHDSDEYGVLRWPLAEVSLAIGAPLKLLTQLQAKGVLKGCDSGQCDPFIYTPRSGRVDGEPVTLIKSQDGPIWYSSRMVVDEYKRAHNGASTRFGAITPRSPRRSPTPSPRPSPPPRHGERQGDEQGDGSSSSSSSSVIPAIAGSALGLDGDAPQPTPSPHKTLCEFWCAAWKRKHGTKYAFAKKDGVMVANLLKHLETERGVQAVMNAFLADDDDFYKGHQLTQLVAQVNKFNAIAAKRSPVASGTAMSPRQAQEAADARAMAELERQKASAGGGE